MYIREMLNVLMNAVKNIYSICVMACDAIKFIPTRTSRVMASQGGSRRKRAEGKEMPARSSEEQAGGGRGKSGGPWVVWKSIFKRQLRAAKRDSSESQVPRANGKRAVPAWLAGGFL